jgi:hypothetical protein
LDRIGSDFYPGCHMTSAKPRGRRKAGQYQSGGSEGIHENMEVLRTWTAVPFAGEAGDSPQSFCELKEDFNLTGDWFL